jgi:hypothetical protein
MALPKIGLQAVLEGYAPFTKAVDTINKKIDETSKKTKEAAKNASPLSGVLDKVGLSAENLKDKVSQLTGINRQAIDGILEITQAFGPMGIAIGAAAIGAVALGAAFIALGNRGAALIPLADSFDNLTASVGLSSKALLVDLRKAANGTVSDFDLIRRANLALVGTSGEFGKAFGKALPSVLASARSAAKATGQDVDFLFQSLVSGIKRASPRLIDNTGIVLKLSEANETLAQQLGKSVDQLTLEEKQIAILNATVAAGEALTASLGDQVESNSEKLARSQAIITNTFDTLAVSVQPAFGTVVDIVNRILTQFQTLATALAPIIGAVASVITDVLGGAVTSILDFIQPVIDAFVSFLPYIAILFQGIANIVHGAVQFIGNVVRGISTFLQDVAQKLFGIDITNLGKNLFEGAAAAFGSFANGILSVANSLIFPAVIGIAKFIADFLIGFSPPKKGPLSQIDKGGENVMKAWLEGIGGVSLDPVEQVAAQVSLLLGDIGKASLTQVDARLRELDVALLPFQNRLDIVKSQFEAIAEPAKAALDAIERQTQTAQEALAKGDVGAANTLRQLDAARAAIQGQLDTQQAVVDQQQIQLGLATAAQAQERALLNIRKAQFVATTKVTAAAAGMVGAKETKPKGGAASTPEEVAAGGGAFVSPDGSVLDLIGGQTAINDAIAGIQDAFAGQIDTSQLAAFGENSAALQEQFGRIGSVDIGAKLGDKFKGLTDLFDPTVENSPANVISRFFSSDPGTPGSIASLFESLPTSIDAIAKDIGVRVGTALADIFVFFTGEGEGTLNGILAIVTGDSSVEGSVANFFSLLPERVGEAASGLFAQLKTDVFDPVTEFLTGDSPESLQGILKVAIGFFEALPGEIIVALQGIGATLYAAFATPIIMVINSVIEAAENTVKSFLGGVANFLLNIADGLGGVIDTTSIRNTANDISTKAGGVNFGRLSTALPAFLQPAVQGAATGGLFGPGALDVGERGKERIFPAEKIGVLPAELTRVLDSLGGILAAPAPMNIPSGNTYNNSSSSFTFNGVQSDNDARRRFNALRAGMR